jgi:hypothetical protein
MDLLELGARSMDLVDLEFLELGCLAGKKWSGPAWSSPKHALKKHNTNTTRHDGRSVSVGTTQWVGRVWAAISTRSAGTNTTRKGQPIETRRWPI